MTQVERSDWTNQLELLMGVRLRTAPYRVAVKSTPGISVPNMPLHSMYVIDGIVVAIGDKGSEYGRESFLALRNNLRKCWDGWERLCVELSEAHSLANEGKHRAPAAADNGNSAPVVSFNPMHCYLAMAALQDLWCAWCVVDGVLKHHHPFAPREEDSLEYPVVEELGLLIERELPQFTSLFMPMFHAPSVLSPSPYVQDAMDCLRALFFDLINSWLIGVVRPETIVRIEEDIRYQSHQIVDDELRTSGGAVKRAYPLESDAVNLSPSIGNQNSKQKSHGARIVSEFIGDLFSKQRTAYACPQCGLPLPSAALRDAHVVTHFTAQRKVDPAARLRHVSVEEFATHVSGLPMVSALEEFAASDYFPSFFCRNSESASSRNANSVRIRKLPPKRDRDS